MAVKAFKTWYTYYDVAQELSASDQGKYWRAIMDYMFADVDREPELPKMARMAFKSVKGNLKRSKANMRGEAIGNESGTNRDEVPDPENALTLTLTSTLTSKADGAGSVRGRPAPPADMPDAAEVACPKCGKTTVARRNGSVYSIRCACGADLAVPWTYIGKGGRSA